jgi:hypothetical protein
LPERRLSGAQAGGLESPSRTFFEKVY